MNWIKVAEQVAGSGAKLLGTALGGSVGGQVGSLVAHALGVENTPEAVSAELEKNPEAYLKLKELESNQKIELNRMALQELQAQLADVQDARKREVDITKATGKTDKMLMSLAVVITSGFFCLLGALLWVTIPDSNKDILISAVSTLGAAFIGVNSYYFGSSHGSAKKTEIMEKKAVGGE